MVPLQSLARSFARTAALRVRSLSSATSKPGFGQPGYEYSKIMDKTGRPVSPHLMIYKLPLIAYSSVFVRGTGILASAGFFAVGGLALIGDSKYALDTVDKVGSIAPTAAKFAVAYTLVYQWFGSARHMYWDLTAKGFQNQAMYRGAYAGFVGTALFSAALALYSPSKPDESKK